MVDSLPTAGQSSSPDSTTPERIGGMFQSQPIMTSAVQRPNVHRSSVLVFGGNPQNPADLYPHLPPGYHLQQKTPQRYPFPDMARDQSSTKSAKFEFTMKSYLSKP